MEASGIAQVFAQSPKASVYFAQEQYLGCPPRWLRLVMFCFVRMENGYILAPWQASRSIGPLNSPNQTVPLPSRSRLSGTHVSRTAVTLYCT
ncbi:hypothetical protein NCU01660 [Neurospora crassa OR74A]|uniref:Uncharacterized protein n=2 Tax=Neurospora crassa TaxID=5141 RepID=Q1K5I5_NEUCR|nr:hypothetical protein NCU01660 [Neurospora crassa OR74A]EAA27630.1 hypothetical protein NCU01660 [Neurospora crassa OR74A]CAD11428.1 putative protein [Neurospora crassa]|eukprot:XP_956866.1 hypothetical protein NCU01660 [Neurospora crassa OR74A]